MQVTYIDSMGSDLSVVNAARVSFGKKSEWEWTKDGFQALSKADQGLISFLARGCTSGDWEEMLDNVFEKGVVSAYDDFAIHPVTEEEVEANYLEMEQMINHIRKMPDHWTPFGHTAITLHIKAPIFVARQLGKHQVGFVWNEVSRRYITDEPEFYVPETWRKAAENVKQGSSEEAVDLRSFGVNGDGPPHQSGWEADLEEVLGYSLRDTLGLYNSLLRSGVCPEQARMILPQSMYTEWYWTGNLYGFANVYNQRTDSHAQKEVRDVAHQIGEIIEPLFPVSWRELTK